MLSNYNAYFLVQPWVILLFFFTIFFLQIFYNNTVLLSIIKCFKIWEFYIEHNAQITFVWRMIVMWVLEPLYYCSRKTDYDRFQAYLGNNIPGHSVFIR